MDFLYDYYFLLEYYGNFTVFLVEFELNFVFLVFTFWGFWLTVKGVLQSLINGEEIWGLKVSRKMNLRVMMLLVIYALTTCYSPFYLISIFQSSSFSLFFVAF